MKPKISVVIPFYNVVDYLPECIDSVLMQTLPELEIVLVDDGSDDGSEKLADKYANDNPEKIKVIHRKIRGGASAARNDGLDAAEGDYVHFLDSDDRLKKNALQVLAEESYSKNLDILFFCAEVFSSDPELVDDVEAHKDEFIRLVDRRKVLSGRESLRSFYEDMKEEYPSPVWTRFYSRKFLNQCGIRFPEGLIHEDEYFGFLTYYYAKRVEQIEDILLERRLRRGSVMYTKSLMDSVCGFRNAYFKVTDIAEDPGTSSEDRIFLIRHSERQVFYTLLFYIRANTDERITCRTEMDPFMDRARKFESFYCDKVQQAMRFYRGEVTENEVDIPELMHQCYI